METSDWFCEEKAIQQTLLDIRDDYEHIDASLEYVLENVLQENETPSDEYKALRHDYNTVLINRCECTGRNACNDSKCSHGGNYIKADDGNELVLSANHGSDIIYECSSICNCNQDTCTNILVQKGPRKNLIIIDSPTYRSKGLATTKDIPSGGFICEYAGELLTKHEARRRVLHNARYSKMNYVLCLNEIAQQKDGEQPKSSDTYSTIVDPSYRGNIGRYLNHSCEPNCHIYSVRVDCQIPKIGIFAKRRILAGEELCFNYGDGVNYSETIGDCTSGLSAVYCLCNSSKCKKFLPNIEF